MKKQENKRFKGNHKGHSFTVTGISKYKRVRQVIKTPLIKSDVNKSVVKTIEHYL